jgi:hypothetical protein
VVEAWLTDALNLLLSGRNAVITLRSGDRDVLAVDVTLESFLPAVSGTEANPAGTNGSYRFTVALKKGSVGIKTQEVSGEIIATPYVAVPLKRIDLLSMGETRLRVINTGNRETGNLRVSLSGANADAFMLPPSEVPGNLSVGDEADFRLVPRADLTPGAYTVTVMVGGSDLKSVSQKIAHRVLPPVGNEAQTGAQGIRSVGRTLYITAMTSGSARVFNLSGQLVQLIPHTAGETVKTVLPAGLYIVTAEGKTCKVMINR